jgi:hypothetical protein
MICPSFDFSKREQEGSGKFMGRRSSSGNFPIRGSPRRFPRIFFEVLLMSIAFALPGAEAQHTGDKIENSLPPGVEIRIDAVPKKATIGDLIQIDLDLTLPPGYQARIPKPETKTGDFSIVDFLPGPQIPNTVGLPQPEQRQGSPVQHHGARISAAVYRIGTFVFPSLPILLRTDKGIEIEVSSPPVSIEIQSVLTGVDQSLKDLKKQADIREPRRWFLWIALLAAACVAAFIVWRIWQRRRTRDSFSARPGRDPLEAASAELRSLLAFGLPEQGREKEFYILLSATIKRIIEIGYRIHTVEQTTSEIMDSLHGNHDSEPESLESIESFLLRCDMVKFAKYVPSKSEQEAVCTDALGILRAVVSRQSPVVSDKESADHCRMSTGD